MSTIVACYKWVIDEADLRIGDDLSVDTSKARGKISDFDKSAIEAAMRAVGADDRVVALTFGSSEAKASCKDALSRGPEEAFVIESEEAASTDGKTTACALAAAIERLDDPSLVFCAEGASDTYARQVGPRLGATLDWPVVTSALEVTIEEGGQATVVRKLDDCLQTVRVTTPAIICVLPEGYEPKVPGLKAVMAAGKKPTTVATAAEWGVSCTPTGQVEEFKGYLANRKNCIFAEGEISERVDELLASLRKEGVL